MLEGGRSCRPCCQLDKHCKAALCEQCARGHHEPIASTAAQTPGQGAVVSEELAAQLRDATADNDALVARLATLGAECDALTRQQAPNGAVNEQLMSQLQEATADNAALTAKVASLAAERDTLMRRADDAGSGRSVPLLGTARSTCSGSLFPDTRALSPLIDNYRMSDVRTCSWMSVLKQTDTYMLM